MLGESAGRSDSNSPRREARRKFSEAERTKNTPLLDDPSYWGEEEFPNKVRMNEWFKDIAASVTIGIVALILVLVAKRTDWIGMIAGGLLVTLVCIVSFYAYNLNRRFNH